jgi:uncharacterized membrane protein YdjX (TVP38/TMEM64 family)
VLISAVAGVIVLGRYLYQLGYVDPAYFKTLSAAYPLASAGFFLVIYAACMVSVVPTLPLNVAAGFLWGGLTGGLLSALGATLGACAAFGAARVGFGHSWVRASSSLPSWVAREVHRLGWRAVAFVRLNPAVPSSIANYAFGATALRPWTYCWASFLFFIPMCVVVAVIGEQSETLVIGSAVMDLIRAALVAFAAGAVLLAVPWAVRLAWGRAKNGR